MKKENSKAAVIVGGVAIIGYLLLIGLVLASHALFPTRTLLPDASAVTSGSSVSATFAYITFFHDLVPGFVVGAVLGVVATFFLPRKRISLLMLPSVIVFTVEIVRGQAFGFLDGLIQKDWSWFFLSFLPMWVAFFIGTACTAVVARKLWFPNKRLQMIDNGSLDTSAPVRSN